MLLFMSDLIGRIIDNKYEILNLIGEGGFGDVHEAKRITDGELVALKSIYYPTNDEHYGRFNREVRIMTDIDHENVIKILDFNLEISSPYIVMPRAKSSLADKIDILKTDKINTLKIFLHACKGVEALHESGICHRDIKPANILVSHDNKILIADLGLGKFKNRDTTGITNSSECIGTDLYIPPEYYSHAGYINGSESGDIYQLGKTLCNLLTGRNPSSLSIDVLPSSLQYIISKATMENPDQRYQSVNRLIVSITHYLDSLENLTCPEDVFDYYLDEFNKSSENDTCDSLIVEKMLESLFLTKDTNDLFLDLFDKIPLKLLVILVNEMNSSFELIIKEYSRIIDDLINDYTRSFEYAEVIAKRMKLLHSSTSNVDYKIIALKIILKTSVVAHRYASMEIFNEILLGINDLEEGRATSILLNEELDDYSKIVQIKPIQINALHFSIREITRNIENEEMQNVVNLDYNIDF